MGVDAKIHVNSEFKLKHVVEYLKYLSAVDVTVRAGDWVGKTSKYKGVYHVLDAYSEEH